MPSFLEKEQIQPIQPFLADVNSIANTFNTKLEYWKQGMSSAKSAYQNYLNLDLTHEANQSRLEEFMKVAKKQLQEIVQSDMSVGDNQQMALSVFNPITSDNNIMGDHSITRFYKEQYQIGESYKHKDNGKFYNANNQNWMLRQLDRFRNDKASNWKSHWVARDGYTPYFDTAAADMEIMKNFKPDILESTSQFAPEIRDKNGKIIGRQDSMYSLHTKDESYKKEQIKLFLEMNRSDKHKKQLAIDGIMAYGDKADVIATDYVPYAQSQMDYYTSKMERLQGLLSQTDPIANPEKHQSYLSKLEYFKNKFKETSEDIEKINSGDLSFVEKNKDRLATYLYTDQLTDRVAQSYSHQVINQELKPDEIKIRMWEKNQDVMMNNDDNANAYRMAQLTSETSKEVARIQADAKKKSEGSGSIKDEDYTSVTRNYKNDGEKGNFYSDEYEVQSTIQKTDREFVGLNEELKKYAETEGNGSFGSNYKNLSAEGKSAAIAQWLANQSALPLKDQDPFYSSKYAPMLKDLSTKKAVYENIKLNAENATNAANPKAKAQYDFKIKEIAGTYGITLDEAKMLLDSKLNGTLDGYSADMTSPTLNNKIKIGDKEVTIYGKAETGARKLVQGQNNPAANFASAAYDMINGFVKFDKPLLTEFVNAKKAAYKTNLGQVRQVQDFTNQDSKPLVAERNNLAFSVNNADITKDNFGKIQSDLTTGRVWVQYRPSSKKPIDIKEVATSLKNNQFANVEYSEETGVISYDNPNFKTQAALVNEHEWFQKHLFVNLNNSVTAMTPSGMYAPGGNNRYFRVQATKLGHDPNNVVYRPVIEDPNVPGRFKVLNDNPFPTLAAAMARINTLATESEKAYKDDLIKYKIIKPKE